MVDKPFEILETYTADIAFIAYGESLEELFENSGKAITDIQTDINKVGSKLCFDVEIAGYDLLSLIRNWLEELLFLRDAENIFASKFEIKQILFNSLEKEKPWILYARVCGEKISPEKHPAKVEIKAISYYDMEFCQKGYLYSVKVLVDI